MHHSSWWCMSFRSRNTPHSGTAYVTDIQRAKKNAFTENSRQFLNLIYFFAFNLLKGIKQKIQTRVRVGKCLKTISDIIQSLSQYQFVRGIEFASSICYQLWTAPCISILYCLILLSSKKCFDICENEKQCSYFIHAPKHIYCKIYDRETFSKGNQIYILLHFMFTVMDSGINFGDVMLSSLYYSNSSLWKGLFKITLVILTTLIINEQVTYVPDSQTLF